MKRKPIKKSAAGRRPATEKKAPTTKRAAAAPKATAKKRKNVARPNGRAATAPAARPRRRRNGDETAAARLFEKFHQKPATKAREIEESAEARQVLAKLGRLVSLGVELPTGQAARLDFHGTTVILASSPDGRQLYFVGGDQTTDLARLGLARVARDHVAIGLCREIVYHTKKGFHNFEATDYVHEMGEDGGAPPVLSYDMLNRRLYLSGGTYQVKKEGIVN